MIKLHPVPDSEAYDIFVLAQYLRKAPVLLSFLSERRSGYKTLIRKKLFHEYILRVFNKIKYLCTCQSVLL